MKNIYFQGLENALNDGCYIKVFTCSLRYPVVRVEKIIDENKAPELISYAEHGNVLAALNDASNKIFYEEPETKPIICENNLIDIVVNRGYTLHFFKLSNKQILSTICTGGYNNYVPVKSVITDNIESGYETLNASLEMFDLNDTNEFRNFAHDQMKPIEEYQKRLSKKDNQQ